MCEWDRLFLERMTSREINAVVYGRYKDDVNFVLDAGGEEAQAVVGEARDRRVME